MRKLPQTLIALARTCTEQHPDRATYTFVTDGTPTNLVMTNSELDERGRAIASQLQDRGVGKGERAVLLFAPGLEYVAALFGCFYAGVTAIPAYPPDPTRLARTLPRLRAIIAGSTPSIILTSKNLLAIAEGLLSQAPDMQHLQRMATDAVDVADATHWQDPNASEEDPAYIQYTSGSTGLAKGVILTHRNVVYNMRMLEEAFGMSEASVGAFWLPPYHDWGLVGGILQPLYCGGRVFLTSPIDFLRRPLSWLENVSRYRATLSGAPNFAYDLCVRKSTPEQRQNLDLSAWTSAATGGEPVRHATLETFARAFKVSGFKPKHFYPCYGMAESVLLVTGGTVNDEPVKVNVDRGALRAGRVVPKGADDRVQVLVGCGRPFFDDQVRIVNAETSEVCRPDEIGEIWFRGGSVGGGYWNDPYATKQTFGAHIARSDEGPFLRTGDLGFIHEGEVFITGRLKDVIIVRGENHYAHDLEMTAEQSHAMARQGCSAAFAVEDGTCEQLVVVVEVDKAAVDRFDEVAGAVRRALAERHGVHAYSVVLIPPRALPKTSSGKIQRQGCRDAYLAKDLRPLWESSFGAP